MMRMGTMFGSVNWLLFWINWIPWTKKFLGFASVIRYFFSSPLNSWILFYSIRLFVKIFFWTFQTGTFAFGIFLRISYPENEFKSSLILGVKNKNQTIFLFLLSVPITEINIHGKPWAIQVFDKTCFNSVFRTVIPRASSRLVKAGWFINRRSLNWVTKQLQIALL